mgnify:CR=1 FL=1
MMEIDKKVKKKNIKHEKDQTLKAALIFMINI